MAEKAAVDGVGVGGAAAEEETSSGKETAVEAALEYKAEAAEVMLAAEEVTAAEEVVLVLAIVKKVHGVAMVSKSSSRKWCSVFIFMHFILLIHRAQFLPLRRRCDTSRSKSSAT